MIALAKPVRRRRSRPRWHSGFLTMVPRIKQHARFAFRHLAAGAKEDAVTEIIASALVAYVRLHKQGRAALAYPTVLARYAVAQFHAGRRVGTRMNKDELLTRSAQRRNRFSVEEIFDYDPDSEEWVEAVIEDTRTCVADQAAFRIDFPAWLATHTPRNRLIAEALAVGHTPTELAKEYGLTAGRISQLRCQFYESWQRLHGEQPISQPTSTAAV